MVRNTIGLRKGIDGGNDWLDMRTIRSRVAKIKQSWTEAERLQRAAECVRRREELMRLLQDAERFGADKSDATDQQSCAKASPLRIHQSSLIG